MILLSAVSSAEKILVMLTSGNFRRRLELMRKMYEVEGESGPDSPDDPMMEALLGSDPFYDRFPWFRMIGRSV